MPIGSRLDPPAVRREAARPEHLLLQRHQQRASQLLTVRDPRARVAKVAPWLTLDGDVYPAVVDGRVEWVVDGYTSTRELPRLPAGQPAQGDHELADQRDRLDRRPAEHARSTTCSNSVKAVVDAYTGQVTLYAWNQADQPDPLLQTWENAFPGLVKPRVDIPPALLPHLRYPQDLFDVQRAAAHPATT